MPRAACSILSSVLSAYAGYRVGATLAASMTGGLISGGTVSAGALALILLLPTALALTSFVITARLIKQFIDKPLAAISWAFLLNASLGVLLRFGMLAIQSILVTTAVNPFSLPFMLLVGASALCVFSIYQMTKPDPYNENRFYLRASQQPFVDPYAPPPPNLFPGKGRSLASD